MTKLADKYCVPCRGGVPPLQGADLIPFAEEVPGWKVIEEHHIAKHADLITGPITSEANEWPDGLRVIVGAVLTPLPFRSTTWGEPLGYR